MTHSALWRRLDTPGHDACVVSIVPQGCTIEGTAIFRHDGLPARLAYVLHCDANWRTRRGAVTGMVGGTSVDLRVERAEGGMWIVNGEVVHGLEACSHLDLGFTPATNFSQIRSLGLGVGEAADLPVAWLDVPPADLQILPQRYERRTEATYWYESPAVPYSALLELAPDGMIRQYPGLWELEP